MPKQYTAMKEKFIKEGMSTKAAEAKAAKIYNAQGKGHIGKGSK